MIDEQGHIALTLAQRRQGYFDHAQAIVQIGTETALIDKVSNILIRSSQKTHVKLMRLGRPKARDALFLNDAQQAHLQIEGHFANLVQKQRSAFGRFNLSDRTTFFGSRKRARLVTKQLSREEITGDCSAIDCNERPLASRHAVQSARHDLFARARLTQKQDIGLNGRHLANELIDLTPCGRLANIINNVFCRSAAKRLTAPLRTSRSPV